MREYDESYLYESVLLKKKIKFWVDGDEDKMNISFFDNLKN